MTDRERLLAILAGESPDRIPWIPRLNIWHEAQKRRGAVPEKYEGWSLRKIERDLGLGTPARHGLVYRTELRNVEVRVDEQSDRRRTEYVTPVGTVSTLHRRSATLQRGGISSWLEVEHRIKEPDDYPVVEYIVKHTDVIPTYDAYLAYEAEIGDDGVPMMQMGSCPMFHILREFIGYNDAFYHLYDHKPLVEHLLAVLTEHLLEVQHVVLDSPAKLILHGVHFDSQMDPPPLFREYALPYFQPFADELHACGKVLACHADADTSRLLELIEEAGFDMAECFVTAPMVPVTLKQAREAWGDRVIIWGGIPSVMMGDPVTDVQFEAYILDLFRTIAPGDAFILGVADNVMAEGKLARVQRVTEMVAEYGMYPISGVF